MEPKELKQLIAFHQSGLEQYRHMMSPATQYLEEQTIKALKELEMSILLLKKPEE